MIKNKFKIAFLGASLLLGTIGCSDDDIIADSDTQGAEIVLSNGDITLTYGSKLSEKYVSIKNTPIAFNRLSGNSGERTSFNGLEKSANYEQPDLTNAIPLVGGTMELISTSPEIHSSR